MRMATPDDWPHIWAMMKRFHAKEQPGYQICETDSRDLMLGLMQTQYVAVAKGGFIAGLCDKNPMCGCELIGKEFLWWSEDSSGARLRAGFKKWCKGKGARNVLWSCNPANDRVVRFYEKVGKPIETVYMESV